MRAPALTLLAALAVLAVAPALGAAASGDSAVANAVFHNYIIPNDVDGQPVRAGRRERGEGWGGAGGAPFWPRMLLARGASPCPPRPRPARPALLPHAAVVYPPPSWAGERGTAGGGQGVGEGAKWQG